MSTRVKEEKVTLNQLKRNEQLVALAQITRNQYALDYWYGHLCTLKEMPFFKHEIKHLFGIITQDYNNYNAAVRSMFRSGEIDAYEMLLDNAGEFHREVKKMVGYYEQAIRRILGRTELPHLDWLMHLSTAKDLLDITAIADGYEGKLHYCMRPLLRLGGKTGMPYSNDQRAMPSAMGHFTRLAGRMNMLILQALGRREDIRYDAISDPDTLRTMNIAGEHIVTAIMNYDLIAALFSDYGHTLEEAKEIVRKKQEKAERRQAEKAFTNTKLTINN